MSLPAAPQAAAASLTQVTNFGTNPSNLAMYVYVPNNVKPNPSILLAMHGCQGTASYMYSSTDFGKLADQYGFIVIYPQTNPSGSCWDVSSDQALKRNGGSDPVGLMSMITYTEQHYGGNANSVFVTGESSGGMMTNVMLADYPDVFKAGAAFMGVPYHCFYTGSVRGWNSPCANGQVSMTAQQWGDLVRNDGDPGYTGPRPRMQLWHGTADTTLNYNNLGEEIKQWTNVDGVSQTPSSSDTPVANWNRTRYNNASGTTQVEAYSIVGAGHQLPIQGTQMAAYAIHFMGLDGSGTTTGNTVTVTSPGNQSATVGTAISAVQVHATDSATGQSLTYSATGLPAGLSISSSGLISGTPTAAGTSTSTVTATDGTGASGSATFTWTVSGGGGTTPGTCHVAYTRTNEWPGGFTANVTITNTGTAAINGWTVGWSFPGDQKITNAWSATATQSGAAVSAANVAYDATIAPGANTSFGFQGTFTANDTSPSSFTVNGAACS
ncbi:extracellular catalytic domain type 1 short-chain-length polyhydroxyalkanoate depolymerase [Catenulispora acidiphila]|uniref:extracellular catalytic domain type 1 short-chain-length polyhydroxyalkanoate depolymerase n=1 Tax=Catenulispora acidiphila TaxID=304895 RepID=UPI001CBF5F6B|nr:PHB depolymerase family esterase [Catenulispora acidiphila]